MCLVAGKDVAGVADQLKQVAGVNTVIVADSDLYHGQLPGQLNFSSMYLNIQSDKVTVGRCVLLPSCRYESFDLLFANFRTMCTVNTRPTRENEV